MRIGLVLNILDEEYQIYIYEGIKQKAKELGLELVCFQQENFDIISRGDFKSFIGQSFFKLDGIIILSSVVFDSSEIKDIKELKKLWGDIPVVSLGQRMDGVPSILVQTDASMKELIQHLIVHHNYRKFFYISGSQNHQDAIRREEIFKSTLDEYKKDVPHLHYRIKHGWFTERAAIEAMDELIQENPNYKPDAIICANDNMAIGVYKYLSTHSDNENLQNCAVTGFDDIPQSEFEIPALTTIRQPLKEIATAAVETLYQMMKGNKVLQEKSIESKLIFRSSCGCQPKYDEVTQNKFMTQVQSNYIHSVNLLKMVGRIGQDLNYATTKKDLRYIINGDMDQLSVEDFCILWFAEKNEDFNSNVEKGLVVEPIYVRRNGKAFYEFAGNRNLPLGEFYWKYLNYDENRPLSLIFKFLSQGGEIKGCVLYDAENKILPYLSSIGIDVSQTLTRIYDLEEKKLRSEYLENEVNKRTKELIEENKKRMQVEAEVLKISEIERQRFSTDLHDDICQRLAGISMLCRCYSNQEASVTKNQMVELAELISGTLSATRQYAHNSYPVEIESLGLNHSISNLCNSFEQQSEIKCKYEWNLSNEVQFNKIENLNIFRIIQEALHNVMKHSKATSVEVSLVSEKIEKDKSDDSEKKYKVIISITDNGCGISDTENQSGLGLNSMQYRANQIDSQFSIRQKEGGGTRVEILLKK